MPDLTDRYVAQYVKGVGHSVSSERHRADGGEGPVPDDEIGMYRIYDRHEDAYVVIPAMWLNRDAHLVAWAMNQGDTRRRLKPWSIPKS